MIICINVKKKGCYGFLQEISSYWQKEFHKKIIETGNFKVIDSLENIDNKEKYVDAYNSIDKTADKNFYMSVRMFLIYICEHAVYKLLIEKCKNVLTFSSMFNI